MTTPASTSKRFPNIRLSAPVRPAPKRDNERPPSRERLLVGNRYEDPLDCLTHNEARSLEAFERQLAAEAAKAAKKGLELTSAGI